MGYTNLKTADELKKNIPKGCRFFYYKAGDNLELIAETNEPAGIGTGSKIDDQTAGLLSGVSLSRYARSFVCICLILCTYGKETLTNNYTFI